MPIIPNSQFEVIAKQKQDLEQKRLMNEQRVNNILLTQRINKEFDAFTKHKDPVTFRNNMRKLGVLFSNDRLQNFEVPEEFQSIYKTTDKGVEQIGQVPKGSKVITPKTVTPKTVKPSTKLALSSKAKQLPPIEAPIEDKGFFGGGKQPMWNEITQMKIQTLKTEKDVEDLIDKSEEYEKAGVDVRAILAYILGK